MDFSPEGLATLLSHYEGHGWLISLGIILCTFILEDAATVGSAILASQGLIPHALALASLITGIIFGDLGLYGLGNLASRWAWARKWVSDHHIAQGRDYLDRSLFVTLFGARCVPGMRLPTYLASGFLGVPFTRFALYAVILAAGWCTALYGVVAILGETVLASLGPWRWVAAIAVIAAALLLPRITERLTRRVAEATSDGN